MLMPSYHHLFLHCIASIILVISLFIPSSSLYGQTEYVDPLQYVNPFIGTGGHGHTYPGATTPFGFVQLSPDTRLTGWDGCGGYHYSDSLIYGFSHTHLQGTGISDYGDILFMPTNSEVHTGDNWGERYRSAFKKENEEASAGYYRVLLDDHNMLCELTATPHVGIHRYTPQATGDSITLFIDMEHRDELLEYSFYPLDSLLVGQRISKAWAQEQHVYFAAQFSSPYHYQDQTFEYVDYVNEKGDTVEIQEFVGVFPIVFDPTDSLICKVALSAVSIDGAINNLRTEAPHWSFNQYHHDAEKMWSDELHKIQVKGGSEEDLSIFYTALYHCLTVPNIFQDANGRYRGTDLRIHEPNGHDNYTVFSLWDTFRAAHPLYTLIERKRSLDFIQSFLDMYEQGGQLPVWELSGNYTGCMIGYHAIPVMVDAYFKGIRNFNTHLALQSMIQISDSAHLGKEAFAEHGYIASDEEHESVSKTLEYACDDWCIAQFAKEMGEMDVYTRFIQRAQHYKNIFNPKTGFMQARRNGSWIEPFYPEEVNFNFTEANSYQYSFFVPQDIEGLKQLMGGEEQFCTYLDRLFEADSQTSGRNQADITGLIGQYAHGNEPSHHMAYLYNYAGQAWKTQKMVARILEEQYSDAPDGLSGNEDCGQMSAWHVLSAMGMYPVTPGSDVYTFGSPLFEEVKINLENGNNFVIKAPNRSEQNLYIDKIELNGNPYAKLFLHHQQIDRGGSLVFEMTNHPNRMLGRYPVNRPKSSIEDSKICPVPTIHAPRTFSDNYGLTFDCPQKDAIVHYRLIQDGDTLPIREYTQAVEISESTKIIAWASSSNLIPSYEVEAVSTLIDDHRTLILKSEYDNQYNGGGDQALIDGLRGGDNYRTGEWQGYWGKDLEAVVDLGEKKKIVELGLGCLQDTKPWIIYPRKVTFWASSDSLSWELIGEVLPLAAADDYRAQHSDFVVNTKMKARYVKVVAQHYGLLPEWHLGHGGQAWLFVDEIFVKTQ